ncbi:hypothetical protein [Leptolyngbya sp. 7M]|uniref:hypothetical protein n=1 Tax=Leptolyngbya sp. 7M TaxID=2812896 RepID=UPI001B8D8D37|nr:hypothetical protein [Leptolyngbya sp. 7M]QYO62341.1 hypothetical protein JVX88_19845 [Leptolyngbya sp. 7M]
MCVRSRRAWLIVGGGGSVWAPGWSEWGGSGLLWAHEYTAANAVGHATWAGVSVSRGVGASGRDVVQLATA